MRSLSNFRTGFPNQLGHISNHAATVAEVLREEGYATFCVGKWHLAPMEQCSAAGPFDQWPLARGFDRFYGFMEGETDQFHPELVCDNHPIEPPGRPGRRLPPLRGPRRSTPEDGVGLQGCASRPTVLRLRPVRRHPRAAPGAGELHGEVPRPVRRGLGRRAPTLVRTPTRARRDPGRHRTRAAQSRRRRVGRTAREPAAAGVSAAGGVRRVPRPHRRPDRPARRRPPRHRPARQHRARGARPTTAPPRRAARSV